MENAHKALPDDYIHAEIHYPGHMCLQNNKAYIISYKYKLESAEDRSHILRW